MKLNKLIALLLAVTMLFAFVGCPDTNSTTEPPKKPDPKPIDVASVTFTPVAGDVEDGAVIELASETDGAVIYYEIVPYGGTATLSAENLTGDTIKTYSEETKPVISTNSSTIYAIAVKSGYTSAVTSAFYKLPPLPADWDNAPNIKEGLKDRIVVYVVDDVEGLKKLSDIVNDGDNLSGYKFKQTKDITINTSVLSEEFKEPAEGPDVTPAEGLVNLDSIGRRNSTFNGEFDGNGFVISGLYMYQSHSGLAFIGSTGAGAVIKNVTIVDACIIPTNASGEADGSDDDRFGGIVGTAAGDTTIENCVFVGVIGSEVAKARKIGVTGDNPYEYGDGLIGRVDGGKVTVKGCEIFERNYSKAHKTATIGHAETKIEADTETFVISIDAIPEDMPAVKNAYVKAALKKYIPPKAPAKVTFDPAATALENTETAISLASDEDAVIYCLFVAGDGAAPTVEDLAVEANLYNEAEKPVITEAGTLYAVAVRDGLNSEIASAMYTIKGDTLPPEFAPKAGKVEAGDTITISSDEDAVIYCLFVAKGGTKPTVEEVAVEANLYDAANKPAINGDGTLYAVAVKEGSKPSLLAEAAYELKVAPSVVTFDLEAGLYNAGTKITLTATPETAVIYYEFVTSGEPTITPENCTEYSKFKADKVVISDDGTFYAYAVNDDLVSEVASVSYQAKFVEREDGKAKIEEALAKVTHTVPTATADIKDGYDEDITDYIVTDVAGLKEIARIVNEDGESLKGCTFTLANDIVINENLLKKGFYEPDEGKDADGKPIANPDLVNLDAIGNNTSGAFSGTIDGNGYAIKGLYIYQNDYKGIGFIGNSSGATLKNLALLDACVIAGNASGEKDGDDDDRFGGVIGITSGDGTVIENVIFEGVVGSAAAVARKGPYEYIGGLVGRCDKAATATNCIVLARIYGDGAVIGKKYIERLKQTNVVGYDAAK